MQKAADQKIWDMVAKPTWRPMDTVHSYPGGNVMD